MVALRKESVDRNIELPSDDFEGVPSLSARRAWIEIRQLTHHQSGNRVALRKESVDRNYIIKITGSPRGGSLSARRAWIEIIKKGRARRPGQSLSARRAWIEISVQCRL